MTEELRLVHRYLSTSMNRLNLTLLKLDKISQELEQLGLADTNFRLETADLNILNSCENIINILISQDSSIQSKVYEILRSYNKEI